MTAHSTSVPPTHDAAALARRIGHPSLKLALFDLDNTLLTGDSDDLWCEFLMDEGLLDRAEFEQRNREVVRRYEATAISPADFSNFYAETLAGRTLAEWRPWCERFLHEVVIPRIPADARTLVETHRELGHRLVMTTATNRVLTELTARHLRIDDLLATEVELDGDGRCTGRTCGVLNMQGGKIDRLQSWLAQQGLAADALIDAVFYSDSSNDLPLLRAVGLPVTVDPDENLRRQADLAGWPVITLNRS